MNNKAHLRPKDFDSSGDIIPSGWKEEKGDLISREALKKALEPYRYAMCGFEGVLFLIDNAPAVDAYTIEDIQEVRENSLILGAKLAQRPQGKWIEHYSKEMSEKGYFLCSKCKCGFQRFERGVRHSDLPWIDGQKYELHCIDNFCPNCGADMRKGDAE